MLSGGAATLLMYMYLEEGLLPVCGMARPPMHAEGATLLQLLSLFAARLECIIAKMLHLFIIYLFILVLPLVSVT